MSPLVHETVPFKIVQRLRKCGPLSYRELAEYIAGVQILVKHAKYIDPSLNSLKRRGYISVSKVKGTRGFCWTITQEGRLAARSASPSVRSLERAKRTRMEQCASLHEIHILRQRRAGIPEELIQSPLDFSRSSSNGEGRSLSD